MAIKRSVYLFGARAMIEFRGPKTDELTEECIRIIKDCNWGWLIRSLNRKYGKKEYNFETIIAAIEYLLDWSIAYSAEGHISVDNTNIISTIFKTRHFKTKQSIPNSKDIWDIYKELINSIICRISKYDYKNKSNPNQNVLREYFGNKIREARTKVYSLNYDRLLPQIVRRKCYDGTIEEPNLDYSFLGYDLSKFIKSRWSYFNLHGSIYLKQDSNYLYKVAQYDYPQHLEYAHSLNGGSHNENKLFSPIVTGYSKSQRILSEPLNFGIAAFMADCNKCDELYIVGYSFSDQHINSIIQNFVNWNEVAVCIIDKGKDVKRIENDLSYRLHNEKPVQEIETINDTNNTDNRYIKLYNKGFLSFMSEINGLPKLHIKN